MVFLSLSCRASLTGTVVLYARAGCCLYPTCARLSTRLLFQALPVPGATVTLLRQINIPLSLDQHTCLSMKLLFSERFPIDVAAFLRCQGHFSYIRSTRNIFVWITLSVSFSDGTCVTIIPRTFSKTCPPQLSLYQRTCYSRFMAPDKHGVLSSLLSLYSLFTGTPFILSLPLNMQLSLCQNTQHNPIQGYFVYCRFSWVSSHFRPPARLIPGTNYPFCFSVFPYFSSFLLNTEHTNNVLPFSLN